jgi:hypothetical protein
MNSTSNNDTMDSAKEWYYWPIYPEYGKGYVMEKNPYKDGVTEYATTEHYKIYFPVKGVYVTVFLKDLMKAQAD